MFGAYIAVAHLWKFTAVSLREPPFSTQNPVPAAAPVAFVNKHPLTMNVQPGWSALANTNPVVVVIPPLVEVTLRNCILPIPLPSFVTTKPMVKGYPPYLTFEHCIIQFPPPVPTVFAWV